MIHEFSSTAIPHAYFTATGQPMVAALSPLDEVYEKERRRRAEEEEQAAQIDHDNAVRLALLAAIL